MLNSEGFIDELFRNSLDEALPGDTAAAYLWSNGAVSLKDKNINIMLGQQTGAAQAARSGADNYGSILMHLITEFGAATRF